MKKHMLTLVGALMMALGVQAQTIPGFQLGIKGALNFSNLRSDDNQWLSSSSRNGYQIGIYTRIGGAIHVQPELYLTGKGSEAEFEDAGGSVKAKMEFTTLDLPVLLGSRVGVGSVAVRFQAGPLISFVVDEKVGDALSQVIDLDDYKKNAFSVVGGVGLDLGKLRADLRYEHALNSLSGDNAPDQRMNVWSIGIGYRLF